MSIQVEDYADLLETLDEILQEEHDVEIAASAATIRSLIAENKRLREVLKQSLDSLNFAQAELEAQAHIPAADAKILQGRIDLIRDVLIQSSDQEGEE